MFSTSASGLLPIALWATGTVAYTLTNNFNAANWMSSFQVISGPDPTNGFVTYLDSATAQSSGLYKTVGNQVFIGVDNTSVLDPNGAGRKSLKLQSNAAFTGGLFIADFGHIPATACGSWPAFWMTGQSWPTNGEIDIIEGINNQTRNQMTIHSSEGCNVTVGKYGQLGSSGSITDCGYGGGYDGCTVFANTGKSYGSGFNNAGGGIYTLHWTSTEIKVWLFPGTSAPKDITTPGATPNPNGWGTPQASFAGCAFDQYFKNMNIMFDTTFCGDWAGKQWKSSSVCSKLATTCNAYAAANPSAYSNSYWLINSVRTYTAS